jgi:hypothetical protein
MGKFKKKLADLWIEILGGLIMLTLTSGATIWAVALDWAGPLILFAIIGSIALVVFVVNQIHIINTNRRRGLAGKNNKKIESTLREWLYKEGYGIRNMPDKSMEFQFLADDTRGRKVLVGRSREHPEFIIMGNVYKIDDNLKSILGNMESDIREDMIEDLRMELLKFKANYIGLKYPMEEIGVEIKVPCDDTCTQAIFLEKFSTAKYAYMLSVELIRKAVRHAGVNPDTQGLETQ